MGQNLIVCDGNRLDFLPLAGVFANQVRRDVGLVDDFANPLPRRDGVGRQDQSGAAQTIHDSEADNGFAGSTGKHDDTTTAPHPTSGIKHVNGFLLIGSELEWRSAGRLGLQNNVEGGAIDVPGQVLRRKPKLNQSLLDLAAQRRVDLKGARIALRANQADKALVVGDFGDQHRIVGNQEEDTGFAYEFEPSVPTDVIDNVSTYIRR